jgi:hypothetical protein
MKSVTDVDVLIINTPTAANCRDKSNSVRFCSHDTTAFLNIYMKDGGSRTSYICASPEMAKKARDELNRIYPVEQPVPTKKAAPNGAQAYRGNGKHEWETVAGSTQRLRVPGGWLYGTRVHDAVYGATFVPVPEVVGYAV